MNHLLARHPDYEQVVQSMTADTLVVYACSDKAKTVFGWLEWLVDGEMLLNFSENALARKYTRLKPLSKATLKKYLQALAVLVEGEITKRTRSIYALIFDHFVAVFVCYDKEGLAMKHLLAFAPLLDDTNQNSPNHKNFIRRSVCDEAGSRGSSNAWSSAFDMLDRFLKIRARAQEGTTVADVRAIFDDVIAEIPDTTHHLNSTAAIVKHAPFENALVKIQRGQGGELTAAELKAAQNLIVTDESEEIDVDAETGLGFAARALQRRRIAEQQEHRFMDTVFLEPTSNSVEWLFSTAKLLFSDKRKRLLPKTLEQLLFLCAKRDLWGLGEVAKVVDHVDRRSS
ncbi:hypothetical protein PC111_g11513 [Phytophthora cactorum]|nr:hypothetical protein PC111_g11513 [Phytophthora cactorum]KAG3149896.1 hypothetical protein C6341_g16898 [Phytophthora cactorum]